MPYRPWVPVAITAGHIWTALVAAGEAGLTRRELRRQLGLTVGQVNYGLTYLRRTLQGVEGQPYVVTTDYRYVLPEHYRSRVAGGVEFLDPAVREMRANLTRLRSDRVRWGAAAARWPRSVDRHLVVMIDRLIEDLDHAIGSVA